MVIFLRARNYGRVDDHLLWRCMTTRMGARIGQLNECLRPFVGREIFRNSGYLAKAAASN